MVAATWGHRCPRWQASARSPAGPLIGVIDHPLSGRSGWASPVFAGRCSLLPTISYPRTDRHALGQAAQGGGSRSRRATRWARVRRSKLAVTAITPGIHRVLYRFIRSCITGGRGRVCRCDRDPLRGARGFSTPRDDTRRHSSRTAHDKPQEACRHRVPGRRWSAPGEYPRRLLRGPGLRDADDRPGKTTDRPQSKAGTRTCPDGARRAQRPMACDPRVGHHHRCEICGRSELPDETSGVLHDASRSRP